MIPLQWVPEVTSHCPTAHLILVGNMIDIRGENAVSYDEGKKFAEEIGALDYYEVTATDYSLINKLYADAVRYCAKPVERRRRCMLL